jgi:hypothetical protein
MSWLGSKLASAIALVALATIAHGSEFWSDPQSCVDMDLENVTITRYEAIHKQGIHGVVSYKGDDLIRDVQVRGGAHVRPSLRAWHMKKGQSAEFLLTVDDLDPVTLTVECEVFK